MSPLRTLRCALLAGAFAFAPSILLSQLPKAPRVLRPAARATLIQLTSRDGYVPVTDSVRLFYRTLGDGPDTVVVVHGGPGFGFNYLAPDLTPLAAHHTLLFFDQRNAGRSTLLADTAQVNAARLVADLEALRVHFKMDRLTLLGHSWGGLLTGLYATQYPQRVRRAVLMAAMAPVATAMQGFNPTARLDSTANADRERNLAAFRAGAPDSTKACWDYYALWARGYVTAPVQARRMWGDLCNLPLASVLRRNSGYPVQSLGRWDLRPALAAVTAPVLIVHGVHDPMPLAAAQAWQAALPNAQLFELPQSAHSPHVEQPSPTFAAIETFLAGGWPDALTREARQVAVVHAADRTGSPYLQLRATAATVEQALVQAVARAQWDSVSHIYADDAAIFAPGVPPIAGRQAIAAFWRAVAKKGMRELDLQLVDLTASGDQMDVVGKYVMLGGNATVLDVGKFVAQYRRDTSGTWRLTRDMFNSSMETRSPLEVPDYLSPPR